MVLIRSTKGTSATDHPEQVGPHVRHRPHEEPARAAAADREPVGAVQPSCSRYSAAAMKSVKVVFFRSIFPGRTRRGPSPGRRGYGRWRRRTPGPPGGSTRESNSGSVLEP